jgi:hypothetical protein
MLWSDDWRVLPGVRIRTFRRRDSWRDGGVDTGIDLRRHEDAPEGLGSVVADLRFEIQREERVKDIAGKEGHQQEALDGVGIVPVDVVGMPAADQFVEPMVFDIPSLVTEADSPLGGDGQERKGGHPDPVAGFKGHRNNNLYQVSVSITEYSFATWFNSKMKDNCDQ